MGSTGRNERLIQFMKQLDDVELSYFYEYKGKGMLKTSRQAIQKEVRRRGIYPKHIIKANPPFSKDRDAAHICPRCGTDKIRIEKKAIMRVTDYGGYEDTEYAPRCRICDYVDKKRTATQVGQRLKRYLGPLAHFFLGRKQ